MARGVNKVILLGNLGSDPEVRYLPNGDAVANFSIATSEGWKDKQTGENQERTEWHRVVLFRRLAEVAGEYLKKGAKVYIEGRIRTRKWQDQSGQDRYMTEIHGDELQMLDRQANGMGQEAGNYPSSYNQQNNYAEQKANAPKEPMPEFNDDIPF